MARKYEEWLQIAGDQPTFEELIEYIESTTLLDEQTKKEILASIKKIQSTGAAQD